MPLLVRPAEAVRFGELLRARLGIVLPPTRTADLVRAIQQAAAAADLPDAAALHELLLRPHPGDPLDALVSALNVGETHFFRDAGQMRALEQDILPELIAARRRERRLRVWSAGCGTGEEPYTLAMLLHRLLPDLAGWDVVVLGTDVNRRSLAVARRGVYRAWSLRGMPGSARRSYLAADGDEAAVVPWIREMVTFAPLNLAEPGWPAAPTGPTGLDLILCRNVLLYFGVDGARAVVRRLRDALRGGGWLLLSQVEAGHGAQAGLVPAGGATFRRGDHPAPHPAAHPAALWPARRPADLPTNPTADPVPDPVTTVVATVVAEVTAAGEPDRAAGGSAVCISALGLWREGRYDQALGLLEDEAGRDPLLAGVHYLHGLILVDRGRGDEALAAFRRCAYADPGFAPAYLGQATLFARSGQRRRAGTALANAGRLAAELDPDLPIVAGDALRAAGLRELIVAQRQLLEPAPAGESRGPR